MLGDCAYCAVFAKIKIFEKANYMGNAGRELKKSAGYMKASLLGTIPDISEIS